MKKTTTKAKGPRNVQTVIRMGSAHNDVTITDKDTGKTECIHMETADRRVKGYVANIICQFHGIHGKGPQVVHKEPSKRRNARQAPAEASAVAA